MTTGLSAITTLEKINSKLIAASATLGVAHCQSLIVAVSLPRPLPMMSLYLLNLAQQLRLCLSGYLCLPFSRFEVTVIPKVLLKNDEQMTMYYKSQPHLVQSDQLATLAEKNANSRGLRRFDHLDRSETDYEC